MLVAADYATSDRFAPGRRVGRLLARVAFTCKNLLSREQSFVELLYLGEPRHPLSPQKREAIPFQFGAHVGA